MTASLLISTLVAALASPAPSSTQSAQSMVCSLLTAADVEAATGAKPDAQAHPAQLAAPGATEPMQMCTWVVRPLKGQVVLSAAHLPPGTDVAALAKNNAGMDALRAANWKEESKDFGGARCAIMTPPASVKEPLLMSSCAAGAKGWVLSVVFTSPSKKLTIDQTKALLDKAAARLH
jgi:hypothetical protein